MSTKEPTHYIVMTPAMPGYWGKGNSIEQAVKNAKWLKNGDRVRLLHVDDKAYIDDFGAIRYNVMVKLGIGVIRGGIVANLAPEPRELCVIARDIKAHWPKPYFGAVPYIDAMLTLTSINQNYGADSAKSIVLYFLSNATTWRGEFARRIKAELKLLAGVK